MILFQLDLSEMNYMIKLTIICFLILFFPLFLLFGSAQQVVVSNNAKMIIPNSTKGDSIRPDSTNNTNEVLMNPDSLLLGTNKGEIVIPYRSSTLTDPYPAQDLYKEWHHEFLTPTSYSKAAIPDQYNIDLLGFEFPTYGKVTSPFGYRKPRQHYGIDLKIPMKDTIRAAFEGKVRIERYEARGYGYYMVIRHPNGLETIYGHLAKFLVKVDQYVTAGEPIALGDNTGRSSGTHLHFETRFMGNPIDPASLIDFNSKSILSQTYLYINPNRKIIRAKETPIISPKT